MLHASILLRKYCETSHVIRWKVNLSQLLMVPEKIKNKKWNDRVFCLFFSFFFFVVFFEVE